MTQDEIIRMAREAGFKLGTSWYGGVSMLERFAALVAAHEREVYAGRVEVLIQKQFDECEAAVLAEREACAKVCEELSERYLERCKNFFDERYAAAEVAATECAAAIRARSEK